jgi:hypothetical protein
MSKKLVVTIALAVFVVAGAAAYAGVDPVDLCMEKKAKAAGKKTFELLKAFGKNHKKTDPAKLGSNISKAESKFTKGFTKAEDKGGCLVTGDSSIIEDEINSVVAELVERLTLSPICAENGFPPQCPFNDPCTNGFCSVSGAPCAQQVDCPISGEECCCNGICL